jgi:hypothetical protein
MSALARSLVSSDFIPDIPWPHEIRNNPEAHRQAIDDRCAYLTDPKRAFRPGVIDRHIRVLHQHADALGLPDDHYTRRAIEAAKRRASAQGADFALQRLRSGKGNRQILHQANRYLRNSNVDTEITQENWAYLSAANSLHKARKTGDVAAIEKALAAFDQAKEAADKAFLANPQHLASLPWVNLGAADLKVLPMFPASEALRKSLMNLGPDPYAKDANRTRCFSQFKMSWVTCAHEVTNGAWHAELLPHQPFAQYDTGNAGVEGVERLFQPIDPKIIPEILIYYASIFAALGVDKTQAYHVDAHLYCTTAAEDKPGLSVPEGMHMDGQDMVFSLTLHRGRNLEGAELSFIDPITKKTFYKRVAVENEAIVWDDGKMAHNATPASLRKTDKPSLLDADRKPISIIYDGKVILFSETKAAIISEAKRRFYLIGNVNPWTRHCYGPKENRPIRTPRNQPSTSYASAAYT